MLINYRIGDDGKPLVPRWSGDTNFMPILAGTRMLSEALQTLYDRLIEAQGKMEATGRDR